MFFFLPGVLDGPVTGNKPETDDPGQAENPDAKVPVADAEPGGLLRATVSVEVNGNRGTSTQPSHRDQCVAVAFQAFLLHFHWEHDPHQAMSGFVFLGLGHHVYALAQFTQGFFFPVVGGVAQVA